MPQPDAQKHDAAINYDGSDPSVECAYPGCTNRLRKSEYDEPQFCSKAHRDGEERPAAFVCAARSVAGEPTSE